MCIYLKNNPDKFHHDPIWNDKALGFFEEVTPIKYNAIWDQLPTQKPYTNKKTENTNQWALWDSTKDAT